MDIDKYIKNLTLEQKIGQLWQVNGFDINNESNADATGTSDTNKKDLSCVGSILNYDGMADRKQINVIYGEMGKSDTPLIYMMDIIHGCRTSYPVPLGLGCSFNPLLMEECAAMSAREAKCYGVDVTFSPMIDLVRDPRWGRVAETTGEDPFYNGVMAAAQIRGYQREGVSACVKHFAAYGAPEGGRDYNAVDMSEYKLRNFYLKPYEMAMKAKPDLVMTSFNTLNGVPMNANKHVVKDILRKEWKFDGVVISDYAAIAEMMSHGVYTTKKQCAEVAINNDIDIEMVSDCYADSLVQLVQEGKVKESQIDKCLKRVLTLKDKHSMFSNKETEIPNLKLLLKDEEHLQPAMDAARESIVLLKNNGVLPLTKTTDVAFVGPYLYERNLVGCWSGYCNLNHKSILDSLTDYLDYEPLNKKGVNLDYYKDDFSDIDATIEDVKDSDVIVAFVGENLDYSGESKSKTQIEFTHAQKVLLRKLSEIGKKLILVIISGRPLIIRREEPFADAILYVNNPGEFGPDAIVETLYGRNNPSGKLDMSIPYSIGQIPLWYSSYTTGRPRPSEEVPPTPYTSSYIDEKNGPMYPFGFGLSYTTFEVCNAKLSSKYLDDEVKLTVTVKNTGKRDGKEVVQVYAKQDHPSAIRPSKELINFKKVFVRAGYETKVEFIISRSDLGFYNLDNKFVTEPGSYHIYVGNSPVNVTELELEVKEKE